MRLCEWCGHAIEQRAHKARLTGAIVRRHCDECTGCARACPHGERISGRATIARPCTRPSATTHDPCSSPAARVSIVRPRGGWYDVNSGKEWAALPTNEDTGALDADECDAAAVALAAVHASLLAGTYAGDLRATYTEVRTDATGAVVDSRTTTEDGRITRDWQR